MNRGEKYRWTRCSARTLFLRRCLGVSLGCGLGTNDNAQNSQMPRHLISDAHEWINEIPPVPI